MMPLTMVRLGDSSRIKEIAGTEERRRFLESLGFVEGERVTVLSEIGEHLIVKVEDTRVALSKNMATQIMVTIPV